MNDPRFATLTRLYERFNARDVEAVLEALHPDVDWPNGWEGGRELGRDAVRGYWLRQWREIDGRVKPVAMEADADGRIRVRVRQTVRALDGTVLSDEEVEHAYTFEDGLITRMDIAPLART
jgi:ketosteroid isomerase-like protein